MLTILSRLLGLKVIRADWEHHGWPSVARLARHLMSGGCAIITPDGGGPRRRARPGALVLAAATGVPLIPIGADCRPAVVESRKWDKSRNPVPFGAIAISLGQPLNHDDFADAAALEHARHSLEQALNASSDVSRDALNPG